MLDSSYQSCIDEIRRDNVSGATSLALRATDLVLQFMEPGNDPRVSPGDLEHLLHLLIKAQPAMAPLLNLANRALLALELRRPEEDWRGMVICNAKQFRKDLCNDEEAVADHAVDRMTTGTVVVTHSYSSSVAKTLQRAHAAGKISKVICSESRPMNEGVRLAICLARTGMAVELIPDGALATAITSADIVLVGADAVTTDGIWNKTGSRGLAIAAQVESCPLFFLAPSLKFLPAGISLPAQPNHDARELLHKPCDRITVRNEYFELCPSSFCQNIINEDGLQPAESIIRLLDDLPVSLRLRTMLSGVLAAS